ncbi:putative antirestriction protein [Shigella sonnei]|nr:putative antirestriction protein [Shigella sonnei]
MQYAKPVTLNVEECDRLSFLPYLFGNDFLYAEAYVYALAQKMMPEYQGGFWHFIRLPDGGGYMMPDGDRFHMVNGANWFDRTVSADAAGIILTSLVINRQLWLYHDSGDAGSVTVYASPSPFSDERPSSRFRGIALPSKRRRLRYSTVGLTRYRTR